MFPQAGRAYIIDHELEERQMPRIARIEVKGEPTVYHAWHVEPDPAKTLHLSPTTP